MGEDTGSSSLIRASQALTLLFSPKPHREAGGSEVLPGRHCLEPHWGSLTPGPYAFLHLLLSERAWGQQTHFSLVGLWSWKELAPLKMKKLRHREWRVSLSVAYQRTDVTVQTDNLNFGKEGSSRRNRTWAFTYLGQMEECKPTKINR